VFTNSHFALAAHILTALHVRREDGVIPSADLASSVGTHPAFLRGLLGELKQAGLVTVRMGKAGGAALARPAEQITLLEVYRAVERAPQVPTHASTPSPTCFVGRNILSALHPVLEEVESAVEARLAQTTVADLARACGQREPP
jgi:Rrf2 family protein